MTHDPGLAADTCTFMEAVSGDGGTHNSGGVWWLSPDIALTGPTSGPDKADPGADNSIQLTFHRKPAANNCSLPAGTESITAEVWVGNPALAMTPDNPASTKMVGGIGSPIPSDGATVTPQPIIWHPLTGLDPSDPQSPGHKCLIARCYADPLTPSTTDFFVPDDPHVAQHNICIVPCGGPGAANRPGPCGFKISTVNRDRQLPQKVTLQAVVDLNPTKFVRDVVMRRLERTHGFRRLATSAPRRFTFELPDFPNAQIVDDLHSGCLALLFGGKGQHILDANIELAAGQLTTFTFNADLSRARLGDAHIFHLRQIGSDKRDQGGLTLVMVVV
jgi:hypothetical protein